MAGLRDVNTDLDFLSTSKIKNLPQATANGEAVEYSQLQAAIEGLSWKDNVRAASVGNVNLAAPGASIDGVALASGDRVLLKDQTTTNENGLYVWTGAAVALTRAVDGSTFGELESAIVTADEGTVNTGTSWRQTQVNGTINTDPVLWADFGAAVAAASETVAGKLEIATQVETDAGTDDLRAVTPLKLATSKYAVRAFSQDFGDASATTFTFTHNKNTRDFVRAQVRKTAGNFDEVDVQVTFPTVNTARVDVNVAPAANAYRIILVPAVA